MKNIRTKAKNIYKDGKIFEIKAINGEYKISFVGGGNHRTSDFEKILELFDYISKKAKGSYGLIYIRDDEDGENHNNFVVHKMKKGEISIVKDELLSPCHPMIED